MWLQWLPNERFTACAEQKCALPFLFLKRGGRNEGKYQNFHFSYALSQTFYNEQCHIGSSNGYYAFPKQAS